MIFIMESQNELLLGLIKFEFEFSLDDANIVSEMNVVLQ